MLKVGEATEFAASLREGMYLRVPVEERLDGEYREYNVGSLKSLDPPSQQMTVVLYIPSANGTFRELEHRCSVSAATRCKILPDSHVIERTTGYSGRVLAVCDETQLEGSYARYYVRVQGQTLELDESQLIVAANRQDPDPWEQLSRYELHNPVWRAHRDEVVESYAQLHNATYGLEDLVGSRVLLLAHQAEVIARVLSDTTCRYMLADEVGLGKTIEAAVILKALRRRHPSMKTLILVPSALAQQWHNELNDKFWIDFPMLTGPAVPTSEELASIDREGGAIVTCEALAGNDLLASIIMHHEWGLLIADEVHQLHKHAGLYERVFDLSCNTERALMLSATPIERRAQEYLSLLKLLDPVRYGATTPEQFEQTLKAQDTLRRTTAFLAPALEPAYFDRDEFLEEFQEIVDVLADDPTVGSLAEAVRGSSGGRDKGLEEARAALAYVSENYRIEARVIRNRRASLQIDMPVRELREGYAYSPGPEESEVLQTLNDYLEEFARETATPLATEFCRILLHAAASSPYAFAELVQIRRAQLATGEFLPPPTDVELSTRATPRNEPRRVELVLRTAPTFPGEGALLDTLAWRTANWAETTMAILNEVCANRFRHADEAQNRLVQALRAVHDIVDNSQDAKVVVFSSWLPTLQVLHRCLVRSYGRNMVAQFHSGIDPEQLQEAADQFQSSPDCAILLCDELGGEGRNFQIASAIVHVDLPWTPTQIEQRIGRVDRLGRTGTVYSFVPYARESVESDLFSIWHEAFSLFSASMSGMEIALEGVQDALLRSLETNLRSGLAGLLPSMKAEAEKIKRDVEEERYFEEGAVNHRRRAEFRETSDRYADGTLLRASFIRWAIVAGLHHSYDRDSDSFTFNPQNFSKASMEKAKLFTLPNMEEALHRSRRRRTLEIRGTFNRSIAIKREDLVFFAPGSDPWTDAIVANALEADRGRCCAILRYAPSLKQSWKGFELLYSLSVDPRPLYRAGLDPVYLFRANGYLATATYRIVISLDGKFEKPNSPICQIMRHEWAKGSDKHLGQRDSKEEYLHAFKAEYPLDLWLPLVSQTREAADEHLREELDFMPDVADDARLEFERRATGWRAARRWLARHGGGDFNLADIEEYERASEALIEGIRAPIARLESACFWHLRSPDP